MAERGAVVIGGGLAGIAAALRLADRGVSVSLLERRPRLGGVAFSFRRGAMTVDNGQHVFLRCCTEYRDFLTRIGADDLVTVQPRLDIPVLSPGRLSARLARTRGVPAPVHLGNALARYALLSPLDRARAVRGALAMRRLDPSDRALDERSFGAFLRAHGQNDATIARLWGVIAVATLNIDPDEASLALAAKVFRTGLLDRADASDVGYAVAPLGDIHGTAAARALADAGVEVLTSQRVAEVRQGTTVRAVGTGGERTWRPDMVVLALPPTDAMAVAPELRHTPSARGARLGSSPIVNVHVIYDRSVTDHAFAAAVDSPVQWVFDRSDSSGVRATHPRAQYLAVTVSAADEIIDVPSKALVSQFEGELAQLLPAARTARIVDAFVTRERTATFRQAVGSWADRPAADSGLDGIWLAGAATDTGWPDTMESAVRSGNAAAEAALGAATTAPADASAAGPGSSPGGALRTAGAEA